MFLNHSTGSILAFSRRSIAGPYVAPSSLTKVALMSVQQLAKVASSTEACLARPYTVFLYHFIRAILASGVKSVAGGRLSQPVTGRVKPQMFHNRTISRVMSKSLDETETVPTGGYSLSHCEGFKSLLALSVIRVVYIAGLDK